MENPFPRDTLSGTEQTFVPVYRCEMCRQSIYTVLIRRIAGRLHLCGFAPRREPVRAAQLPEKLTTILSDADQAVAEGDTYAAFYHLRTLIEHYLKVRLGVPITNQIRGDELVERHYATFPQQLTSILPPLSTSWVKLSEWLHTRSGSPDDYQKQCDIVLKHITAVDAMGLGG